MSEWFWKKLSLLAGWAAVAVLFGLMIFAANIEIKDLDLWLHLATGRYIIQHFVIPKVDILSCTIAGSPWINHEWLFQIIVYLIYNWAGPQGLITLQVVVVGVTFVHLILLGLKSVAAGGEGRERLLGVVFVLLLVLLVYQLRFTLRPDIFSLLFFVLYVYIIALHLDKKGILVGMFLLQALWSNFHGFFILGPALVFIGLLAEWLKRHAPLPFEWNEIGRLTDDEYRRMKQLLAAVIFACLLNPYFIKGAWYPVHVLFSVAGESKIFFSHIKELHRPISWHTLFSFGLYPYYKALIVISFLSFLFNRRKSDIGLLLLWLVFLILSLMAVRNVVFFAITAYLVFIVNAQNLSFGQIFPVTFNNKKFQYFCSTVLKIFMIIWMLNYMDTLAIRGYFDFAKYQRKSEFGGVSLRNFPHRAVDFLVENKIEGNFFNDFNSGAYLLGRAHPKIKVFIDGRTEVYGAGFFKNYRRIWKGDTELFDEAADQYHLTGTFLNSVYVPAPEQTIKHLYDSKEWILVYFDYDAAIFLRDIPENKRWIERFALDLSQWQPPQMDLLKLGLRNVTPYQHVSRAYALFNLKFSDKAREEALEALRVEPFNGKAHKLLGMIHIERDEFAQAYENLRRAKIIDPDDMDLRYLLAVSFYQLGDFKQAKEQCQKIINENRKNTKGLFLLSLIYAKEQKYARSFELLQEAHKLAPKSVEELLKVGDLLIELKEIQRAKEVYALALEADPENDDLKRKMLRAKDTR